MSIYELKNEFLTVKAKSFGAELISIVNNETGEEYLWNGDEKYWKRNAPVLFPIVGSLKNGKYIYGGKEYPMGQHGFARDMEFELFGEDKDRLSFVLKSDASTLEKYPFMFELYIDYVLEGSKLKVNWKVVNTDKKTMYFSIGGHPAFMCPLAGRGKQSDYYILFDTPKNIEYGKLSSNGLLAEKYLELDTNGGVLKIDEHLFDDDALIIEDEQTKTVSLAGPDKKAYLTVQFDIPLLGLWSPAKKNAPFVCIEPWNGRCDSEDFVGELKDREFGNSLEPGEIFESGYDIIVRFYDEVR